MSIKAIISDIGNVLLNFDHHTITKRLANYSLYPEDRIYNIIIEKGTHNDYDKGLISSNEFYQRVKDRIKANIDFEDFANIWKHMFYKTEDSKKLKNLLIKLKKSKNLKIGVLSNINELHYQEVTRIIGKMAFADFITLSYEIHSVKPEKGIYQNALTGLKIRAEECIYMDDIKEYAEAASRIGIIGIHYTGYDNFVKELKELKVL